jgi:hypothetical protein
VPWNVRIIIINGQAGYGRLWLSGVSTSTADWNRARARPAISAVAIHSQRELWIRRFTEGKVGRQTPTVLVRPDL